MAGRTVGLWFPGNYRRDHRFFFWGRQKKASELVDDILADFDDAEPDASPAVAEPLSIADAPAARPPGSSQPLIKPLTNRELDVLELLAERLQIKPLRILRSNEATPANCGQTRRLK